MRFTLITLTLACGFAVAADGPKTVTYIKGSVEGLSPNETATMTLPDTKVLVLKTKDSGLEIPYAAIVKSGRAIVEAEVENEPLYKVWSLHERLLPPAPKHQLTLDYKTKSGVEQSVTLSMDKATADKVMAHVDRAAARNSANAGNWWGDDYWKTKRNQNQWGGAGTVAQRE